MFSSSKTPTIGIDIGRTAVKIVQFKANGGLKLRNAVRIQGEFPTDTMPEKERNEYTQRLKKALSHFEPGKLVISLPVGDVDIRPLTLPYDKANLTQRIGSEMSAFLGAKAESSIIDYIVLGEAKTANERRYEVLAAAVPRDNVTTVLNMVAKSGYLPMAVDIIPLALGRLRSLKARSSYAACSETSRSLGA